MLLALHYLANHDQVWTYASSEQHLQSSIWNCSGLYLERLLCVKVPHSLYVAIRPVSAHCWQCQRAKLRRNGVNSRAPSSAKFYMHQVGLPDVRRYGPRLLVLCRHLVIVPSWCMSRHKSAEPRCLFCSMRLGRSIARPARHAPLSAESFGRNSIRQAQPALQK